MSGFGELSWTFGLKNHAGNYLTAETFGFRLNCASKVMKKKQIFALELEGDKAYIRTHLNRYLSFKADGRFTADAESKGEDEAVALVPMPGGKVALQTARGAYAGGNNEQLDAFAKKADTADRLWTLQLALHPQVCIRHVMRKRYVRENGGQLTADLDVPWGGQALITLITNEDGSYSMETEKGSFLSSTGELKKASDDSCKFSIEFARSDVNKVLFRGSNGKYLAAVGGTGALKASKDEPTRDDQFVFEDSQPQFKLKNIKNMRFASVRSSEVEVQVNQPAAGDSEYFQLEINPETKQWSVRTQKGLFWSCKADGSIHATTPQDKRGPSEWFTVAWLGPRLTLTACNGKLVSVKANGSTYACDAAQSDENTFQFEIINRPKLVLRGEQGFVGALPSTATLNCGRAAGEVFTMHVAAGICHLSSASGKYWVLKDDKVAVVGEKPDDFTMEFVEHSKMAIRAPNGLYLQGNANGELLAKGRTIDASTLWEY